MSRCSYSTFADSAPVFFEEAINVIPIVRETKVPPKGFDWKCWQKEPQTRRDVNKLRDAYSGYDIAAVLGEVSDNLIDLDPDSRGGAAALASLALPETYRVMSPRGYGPHKLYRAGSQ